MSKKLRILIADHDDSWVLEAKEYFEKNDFDVDYVTNGKDAQKAISDSHMKDKNPYFHIILNLEIENYSGPQVMKFIKMTYPSIDTTIILDNNRLLEMGVISKNQISRIGAVELFIKPFDLKDLQRIIDGNVPIEKAFSHKGKNLGKDSREVEEVDVDINNYYSVPINEFIPNKKVLFDVFIRINDQKFLKILHSDDVFDAERLTHFRDNKKVKTLFFHKKDRKKYIRFCNLLASRLIQRKRTGASDKKNQILTIVARNLIDEIDFSGVRAQSLQQAQDYCDNLLEMIQSDKELFKFIRNLSDLDPSALGHSYMVSLISVMISHEFKWDSKQTLEAVGLGGLLHDIGKASLPSKIVNTPEKLLDPDDLKRLHNHPMKSAEMISNNRLISPTTLQVIRQHHEYVDGTGYPQGIKDESILTFSKIVSAANILVEVMEDKELKPHGAMNHIHNDIFLKAKINKKVYDKLINCFKDPMTKSKNTELGSKTYVVVKSKKS